MKKRGTSPKLRMPAQAPDVETTLKALQAGDGLNKTIYYGLSGLTEDSAGQLAPVWNNLAPSFRRKVMRALVEATETNVDLDYSVVGRVGLEDSDDGVREAAVEVLWDDETTDLMRRLMRVAQEDSSREVRAAAASALGRFILLGEMGDLPEKAAQEAQNAAIGILNDESEDVDVRRRALEAIGNSSNPAVLGAIREAYTGDDRRMQVSAVFAMGRSYDEQWNDTVLRELDSDDPEMRYEAARAAGELELEDGIARLSELVFDDDIDIRDAAIWALGEIGGKEALRVLNLLAEHAREQEDTELIEALEDAIASANLAGDLMLVDYDDLDNPSRMIKRDGR